MALQRSRSAVPFPLGSRGDRRDRGDRRPDSAPELTRAFSPVYLDAMPRRVLVTAPVPTLEETAREIGLSQKRARQIAEVMDAIVEKRLASGRLIRRRGKAARRV